MPVCRARLEWLRAKSNEMKEIKRFSAPLPIKMKNLKSTERLLPLLCLSAHFRRPGHVAAWLAGEQTDTAHGFVVGPCLGGPLVSL